MLPTRYTQVSYLAEGTFGTVYRAVDDQGRAVAVKVLAERWAGDPAAAWQFAGEYRRLARLRHPAFPRAYEEGRTAAGLPFYAMELVEGRPLDQLAPLEAAEVHRVLGALAEALEALHALGWVHQDLKPENVIQRPDGRIAVLDVGQVAVVGSAREAIAGTPEYMAPEVFRKDPVAPASDWYALGALAYHLWTGRPPFRGGPAAQLRAHLLEPAPAAVPASGPADEALARLLAALLAKDPAARPDGAALGLAPGAARRALLGAPVVGRDEVLAAWQAVLAGDRPALHLAGPRGSGKSRLLAELRVAAQLAGRTWLGVSLAGEREAPGGAARALVQQALGAAGLTPEPLVAAWLAGEMPAELAELESRARQLAIRAAATRALAEAAATLGGLAIGLDQWEEAPEAARAFFEHLRRNLGTAAVWAIAELAEAPGPDVTWLAPLGEAEVARYAALRLGAEPPAGLLEALAPAAGNPLMLELLLGHAHETGALAAGPDGWRYEARGHGGAPELAAWALARLEPLGPAAARLAEAAAVAAPAGALPVPLLGEVAGLVAAAGQAPDAASLAEAGEALAAAGLATIAAGRLRLTFPGLAEALRERLAPEARAALAAGLAKGLMAGAPASLERLGPAAWLAREGSEPELAARLGAEAGRRALQEGEAAAALGFLELAESCLPAHAPERAGLRLDRADAERFLDRLDAATASYEAVLAAEPGAEPAARAALGLGKCLQMQGRYADALALVERARERALDYPLLTGRALAAEARLHVFLGAPARAIECVAEAATWARQLGSAPLLAQALNLWGLLEVQADPEHPQAGFAKLEESLALSTAGGDRLGQSYAWDNLGNSKLALGDLAGADEAFTQYAAISREAGNQTEELFADLNRAIVAAELGNAAPALALARDVAARSRAAGRKFPLAAALAVEAQAAWRGGQPALARPLLDRALALALGIKNKLLEEHVRALRLEAFAALGRRDALALELVQMEVLAAALDDPGANQRLALARGEAALLAGDHATAAAEAGPLVGVNNQVIRHRALRLAARAALHAGDLARAREAAEGALGLARAWGAPWHLALDGLLAARAGASAELRGTVPAAGEPAAAGPLVPLEAAGPLAAVVAAGQAPPAEAPAAWRAAAELWQDQAGKLGSDALQAMLAAWGITPPPGWPSARAATGGVAAIAQLAAALVEEPEEQGALAACLQAASAFMAADRGYVLAFEDGRLRQVVTRGLDYHAEAERGFSQSIVEEALFLGEPLYVMDAAADERWQEARSVMALALRTVVCVPLMAGPLMLGALYLEREAVEPVLGAAELETLQALGALAALHVTGARARREALADARALRLALELAEAAPDERRERLLAIAARELGAERGLWLVPAGDGWQVALARDAAGRPLQADAAEVSQGVAQWVAERGEPLSLLDVSSAEGWRERGSVQALGVRTLWCAPAPDGVVYLDLARGLDRDPAPDLALLQALVARISPSV